MSKPNKKITLFKNYIIGIILSCILIFGSMGIGYYLKLIFTRLSVDQLLILSLLCITFGLFIGEFWNHSITLKQLKDLKESSNEQE